MIGESSRPSTPSRRRIAALGTLWLVMTGAVLLAPGCYGRNCDPSFEVWGGEPGQGRMIDEDSWETSPIDGKWLWFPRQRYYVFDIPALSGRTPALVVPYLSAQEEPRTGNFTVGGGNLALLSNALPNRIDVKNDTCSDYYLRLYITVPPLPPDSPDGGPTLATPELDAGTNDAGDDDDAGP